MINAFYTCIVAACPYITYGCFAVPGLMANTMTDFTSPDNGTRHI